jgi:HD-GYP domain-containing protein (c-di-GMP phosphodiesterase class II)
MLELASKDIVVQETLEEPLYHASGELLHQVGECLHAKHLEFLEQCKIETLYKPDKEQAIEAFLKELEDSSDSENPPKKDSAKVYTQMSREYMAKELGVKPEDLELNPELLIKDMSKLKTPEGVEEVLSKGEMDVKPEGEALQDSVKSQDINTKRSETFKRAFVMVHSSIIDKARAFFSQMKTEIEVSNKVVTENCKQIVRQLVEDKTLLLNLTNIRLEDDYLITHSMNVAVLSCHIATTMGYNQEQVLEVAFGSFLADVGMLKIPDELVKRPGKLSISDKLEFQKHITHGIDMLSKLQGVPHSTLAIISHSHERFDGSGYPSQKEGNSIHAYARILGMVDTYDAGVSKRPYRKGSHPHHTMQFIIDNADKKFDEKVVEAFVKTQGHYPIGSWLRLANGRIGKVIAVNEEAPEKPGLFLFPTKDNPEEARLDLAEDGCPEIQDLLIAHADIANVMQGF